MCEYKILGYTGLFSLHIERPSYHIFHSSMENQSAVAFHAGILGTLLNTNDKEFVNHRLSMATR